jgi:hypothetical protein
MNRSPAGEETLVFIGYIRVSKAYGSQMVDLQRDARVVTGVAADQLDLDRGAGKRNDRPGFPLQDDGIKLQLAQAARENSWTSSFLTREPKLLLNDNDR